MYVAPPTAMPRQPKDDQDWKPCKIRNPSNLDPFCYVVKLMFGCGKTEPNIKFVPSVCVRCMTK